MPRVAFRLRIKDGKKREYDAAHRNVWPALLTKLKDVGISNYSIFRREQDLFLSWIEAATSPFLPCVTFKSGGGVRGSKAGSGKHEPLSLLMP